MALKLELTEIEEAQKLSLHGRLDSDTSNLLETKLLGAFETPGSFVLMDFSALDYISSAGLRVIVMAAKKATQTQGKLLLFALQPNVKTVLTISGLIGFVEVFDTQESALNALK